jgi:hypothetical protein
VNKFLLIGVAIATLSASANAAVVTPTNTDGWQQNNIRGTGTVAITGTYKPAGEGGSLQFTTSNSVDKADYVKNWGVVAGRTLGNISNVGYDWFRASSSTTAQHLAPALRLAYRTAANETGYLIYENVYNGGSTSAPVTTDAWVVADTTDANFWMRAFGPGRTIEQYDVTLSEWAAGYRSGDSHVLDGNTSITGIEVGVGSGWANSFDGAVDHVRLAFGSDTISADFEPDAIAAVPEPASWGMMILGFGVVGAGMRRRKTALAAA